MKKVWFSLHHETHSASYVVEKKGSSLAERVGFEPASPY
jgi:hypothetical protein